MRLEKIAVWIMVVVSLLSFSCSTVKTMNAGSDAQFRERLSASNVDSLQFKKVELMLQNGTTVNGRRAVLSKSAGTVSFSYLDKKSVYLLNDIQSLRYSNKTFGTAGGAIGAVGGVIVLLYLLRDNETDTSSGSEFSFGTFDYSAIASIFFVLPLSFVIGKFIGSRIPRWEELDLRSLDKPNQEMSINPVNNMVQIEVKIPFQ